MTNNHDDQRHSRWLLLLASNLKQAIQTRLLDLVELQEKLTLLVGITCTGRPHWRDLNSQRKTAKLYIIHSIDTTCPLHGTPERGKRIRSYIGTKPDKITAALAAIEREKERRNLADQLHAQRRSLGNASRSLCYCYHDLNYVVPPVTKDQQPYPREFPQ